MIEPSEDAGNPSTRLAEYLTKETVVAMPPVEPLPVPPDPGPIPTPDPGPPISPPGDPQPIPDPGPIE